MTDSRIRLLLLDFDGTLADTRRANTLAYVETLREAGYALTEEEYAARYFGMRCEEFLTRIGVADPAERERLRLRKIALYPRYFDTVRLNRPLWEFCRQFRAQGGRVWIVSTGSRANIGNVMRHLGIGGPAAGPDEAPWAGWTECFPARTSHAASPTPTVSWRPCAAKDARRAKRLSSRIRPSASRPPAAAERAMSSSDSELFTNAG